MKKEVILVGGAGYVGTRLTELLVDEGYEVEVIDPLILGVKPPIGTHSRMDVRTVPTCHFEGKTVIYLASIHAVPPELARQWEPVAAEIMLNEPTRIASVAKRFIYISSMRARTDPTTGPEASLYSHMKRCAERRLFQLPHVTVVRPGTVWGDVGGAPSRRHTVPNRYLCSGELPDEHWSAYTCCIWDLIERIQCCLTEPGGEIIHCIDHVTPCTRDKLPKVVASSAGQSPPWKRPLGQHPMELYAKYYKKEWK